MEMAVFGGEEGELARRGVQERRLRRRSVVSLSILLALVSTGLGATVVADGDDDDEDTPQFGDWSTPVNLGPIVNSATRDAGPAISKDGLSLYFNSVRPGGFGLTDLWVSQRASEDDPWGSPMNLGPTINTGFTEAVPAFSRDGHWMFFNRLGGPGGLGAFDVWASYRKHVHDDFGWQTPVNLGPGVNSASNDAGASYFENDDCDDDDDNEERNGRRDGTRGGRGDDDEDDDCAPLLFFGSDRAGGPLLFDIFVSAQLPDGSWGVPEPVTEVNSPLADQRPSIRSDGLELFFFSNRPGGIGGEDFWVSTRDSTSDPWTTPVNLGAGVNSPQNDRQPYLSSDGKTLFFASERPGGGPEDSDLWMTTRARAHGDHDDEDAPRFGDWSAPINIGAPPNGPLVDQTPAISSDGLTLYFFCIQPIVQGSGPCPGNLGSGDIWFSKRASVNDRWGPPQNPGSPINTAALELSPDLSEDGRTMYFTSSRPGGFGGRDLYVSHRDDPEDDFGWQTPVNLGAGVNTDALEDAPGDLEDEETGTTTLYFHSNRAGGPGLIDIYVTALQDDGTFGPSALVPELSTAFNDQGAVPRRDGLELFISSDRPGTLGLLDVWVSTRADTEDPWSTPVSMGPAVNSAATDGGQEISCDGTALYLHSNRPGTVGSFDIWVTTRPMLGDLDDEFGEDCGDRDEDDDDDGDDDDDDEEDD